MSGATLTAEQEAQRPHVATGLSFQFYRKVATTLLGSTLWQSLCNIILVISTIYFATHIPEPRYFALYPDGTQIELNPLDEPLLSPADMRQWVVEAVNDANTYAFGTWKRELLDACNEHFTNDGCKAFFEAQDKIGNLRSVERKKLNSRSVIEQKPLITGHGLEVGITGARYYWTVTLAAKVFHESSKQTTSSIHYIELKIVRASKLFHERGVAIESYIAR